MISAAITPRLRKAMSAVSAYAPATAPRVLRALAETQSEMQPRVSAVKQDHSQPRDRLAERDTTEEAGQGDDRGNRHQKQQHVGHRRHELSTHHLAGAQLADLEQREGEALALPDDAQRHPPGHDHDDTGHEEHQKRLEHEPPHGCRGNERPPGTEHVLGDEAGQLVHQIAEQPNGEDPQRE